MGQVENCINDKNILEKEYGFKVQVIGENEEKKLSLKTLDILCDWCQLCSTVFHLLNNMNKSSKKHQIDKLCNSVHSLYIESESVEVHVFGSQIYELATENSDVDLYIDIGGTFDGSIANDKDIQLNLIKYLAKQCHLRSPEFKNIQQICDTSVPIVKFYHVPTRLNCDVTFISGLSVLNTKLVKLYLSISKTVKWFVCFVVKLWAKQNGLLHKTLFTSYALVWLALFYLMTEKIVPPIAELMKCATPNDHKIIEGWDCTFGKWTNSINTKKCPKLLIGFFQYYAAKRKLKNNILCTFTGKLMVKRTFFLDFYKLSEISEVQRHNFKKFESKVYLNFEKNPGLVVQDPFNLVFNLTKNISGSILTDFCDMCIQSATLLGKTRGYISI